MWDITCSPCIKNVPLAYTIKKKVLYLFHLHIICGTLIPYFENLVISNNKSEMTTQT